MTTTARRPAARRDAVFRAVADPTRRRILEMLRRGPLPAGEIARRFSRISRPAVSKHLRLLRHAQLVEERRLGRVREYHLSPEPLRSVDEWVAQFERFWDQALLALKRYAEANP